MEEDAQSAQESKWSHSVSTQSRGWFKASRGPEALELIKCNPLAFTLAYIIAHRARWHDGFNRRQLGLGEAMLGDHEACGMTEQQYRTAKAQLQKWGFATFRSTNKGTIGKLLDSRLFEISDAVTNEQNHNQATDSQRTGNGPLTTNEEREETERAKEPIEQRSAFKVESTGSEAPRGGMRKVNVRLDALIHNPRTAEELEELCLEILGKDEMAQCGSRWRSRIAQAPEKLRRVLTDIRSSQAEGRAIKKPGAYAEDLWKRFA